MTTFSRALTFTVSETPEMQLQSQAQPNPEEKPTPTIPKEPTETPLPRREEKSFWENPFVIGVGIAIVLFIMMDG